MTFSVGLFADGTDAVTVTGITRPGHDGRVILNSATSSFPLVFFKPQIGSTSSALHRTRDWRQYSITRHPAPAFETAHICAEARASTHTGTTVRAPIGCCDLLRGGSGLCKKPMERCTMGSLQWARNGQLFNDLTFENDEIVPTISNGTESPKSSRSFQRSGLLFARSDGYFSIAFISATGNCPKKSKSSLFSYGVHIYILVWHMYSTAVLIY